MLAVNEMHKMGYERIRLVPSMAPSGCFWRYAIVPVSCVSQVHGARLGRASYSLRYPAGSVGDDLTTDRFGDKGFETPSVLAEMILKAFPEIVNDGRGENPEYATWYENMVQLTAPDGVIYASADYAVPDDSISCFYSEYRDSSAEIRLPPPGEDSLEM